ERVRPLFERRVVQVQRAALPRQDVERIIRRPVQVARVQERTVEVDHHRTRMIVPEGHENAFKEVSKAAAITKSHEAEREKQKKATVKSESKNTTQARSHEQMAHHQPAVSTSKEQARSREQMAHHQPAVSASKEQARSREQMTHHQPAVSASNKVHGSSQ